MNIKSILFFLSTLMLASLNCNSQIKGTLIDKQSQKPIKNAIVFIDKTDLKSISGPDGTFTLEYIPTGFVKLVVYKEKYKLFNSTIRIEPEKTYTLNLGLEEITTAESQAEYISKTNEPVKQLESILLKNNTTSVSISKNKNIAFFYVDKTLKIQLNAPLELTNNYLGYQLSIFLSNPTNLDDKLLSHCFYFFDSLNSENKDQYDLWKKHRNLAYYGSVQHFLKSIVDRNTLNEGFSIEEKDGKKLDPDSLSAPSRLSGYTKFNYTGLLQVRYHLDNKAPNEEEELTAIHINSALEINSSGFALNEGNLIIQGSMEPKIELLLPVNFTAKSSLESEKKDWKNFALLQEKTFISTDQDYYYPGETIWFSTIMNYRSPTLMDSLSRVLYVEFIDSNQNRVFNKNIRITQGIGHGEITLPDTLTPANYYLRAYSSWMRNYGDSLLFTQPVPVLDYSKSLAYFDNQSQNSSNLLNIDLKTEKENYQPAELVNFYLAIKDKAGTPLNAKFSISVIDLESSARIPELKSIQSALTFSPFEETYREGYFDKINYHLERGISFSGQVKNIKGDNTQANVDIIQQRIRYLVSMETDENGLFTVVNLDFTDSLAFSIKPTNAKGKPLNFVSLIPRSAPSFYFPGPPIKLDFHNEVAPRIRLLYEENQETKLLEDVVVTGRKIDPQTKRQEAYSRILGKPDNTVDGDILKTYSGSNFLEALQGRVPGLRVIPNGTGIDIKLRGQSIQGSTTPIILVDGVEFEINAVNAIPIVAIDRIDVIRRAMPILGSRGGNGVIAIYTKTDVSWVHVEPEFTNLVVKGYDRPSIFIPTSMLESQTENQSIARTIFWQPINHTQNNEATQSFIASNLPGRYGIIIKGIANNIPFETFKIFIVD